MERDSRSNHLLSLASTLQTALNGLLDGWMWLFNVTGAKLAHFPKSAEMFRN